MKRLSMILVMISLIAIFAGCQKGNEKGNIKLFLTDAPIDTDGITGVYISVIDVQYQENGNSFESFEGFEGPQVINLLDFTRGVTHMLGAFEMEPGTYNQLRFMLQEGSYLEFENGSRQPLVVPSGAQSGFKGKGTFTVPSHGMAEITADFDVRKSVVKAGASGKYILKPVIRLIDNNQAGKITGTVASRIPQTGIVVYAYEQDTFTYSEAGVPDSENTSFPNAVSSDKVDASGKYHIDFLSPMTYDLVVVVKVDGIYNRVLGIIENVLVEKGKTTVMDIEL
jgi:hypothetical protein